MEEIYDYIKRTTNNEIATVKDNNGYIDNIFVNSNNVVYYSITGPHSGNGFTFLVRADYAATHDRWSNCLWDYNFNNEREVIHFFRIGGLEAIAMYVMDVTEMALETLQRVIADAQGRHFD